MKFTMPFIIVKISSVLEGFPQYINWAYVMEKEFKGHFKIVDIFDLEHERRKQHDD